PTGICVETSSSWQPWPMPTWLSWSRRSKSSTRSNQPRVGARSLEECLSLQLQAQVDPDLVALHLVDGHLKALGEKRYEDLARALAVTPDRIVTALAAIRRLEPRPGRPFGGAPAQTVRPEVAIEKSGDGYRVVLRDSDVPQVHVSRQRWAEA